MILSVAITVTHSNKRDVTMLSGLAFLTVDIAICPTDLKRTLDKASAAMREAFDQHECAKSIVFHLRRRNCHVSCEPVGCKPDQY